MSGIYQRITYLDTYSWGVEMNFPEVLPSQVLLAGPKTVHYPGSAVEATGAVDPSRIRGTSSEALNQSNEWVKALHCMHAVHQC